MHFFLKSLTFPIFYIFICSKIANKSGLSNKSKVALFLNKFRHIDTKRDKQGCKANEDLSIFYYYVFSRIVNNFFIKGLFAWHCDRGAESVTGTYIQFHNFVAADNFLAGISFLETKVSNFGLGNSMALVRSVVIGRTMGDQETSNCGDMGIESPWEVFAFTVHDIAFFNYDQTNRIVVTYIIFLLKINYMLY